MDIDTIAIISWAAVITAIIHVLEEYFMDWIDWAKTFVPTVKFKHFLVINILFIILCIVSAIVQNLFLLLSVFALLFVNALVHIVPTIAKKKYSPSLISALILYLPISIYGWILTKRQVEFSPLFATLAIFTGISFMAVPFIIQLIIGRKSN